MTDDSTRSPDKKSSKLKHDNDNGQRAGTNDYAGADVSHQFDAVVMSIARLIGRQIAREEFASPTAANDNRKPKAAEDD